ncbi:MAG: hypothetical protein ACFB10_16570 [Salibacteraceae bacterium]
MSLPANFRNTKWLTQWPVLVGIVVLGTLVRWYYGLAFQGWLSAPDQQAWQLTLDYLSRTGDLRYATLIHYPHEGGSFLISLLALLFKPLSGTLPALSLVALVVDFFSRTLQLVAVKRLFGNSVALAFVLWSAIAIPTLLPWATVNFGLHALSAFWPLIFLLSLKVQYWKIPVPVGAGLVTGLALSMSYDNVILVPAFLVWLVLQWRLLEAKWKVVVGYGLALGIAILPHLLLRTLLDPGFELQAFQEGGIRGQGWFLWTNHEVWYHRFWKLIYHALPGSSYMPDLFGLGAGWVRKIWLIPGLIGFFIVSRRFLSKTAGVGAGVTMVLVFLLLYALSPFFTEAGDSFIFVSYRHLTFVLPLFVVLAIGGWWSWPKWGPRIAVAWIGFGILGTFIMVVKADKPTATFDPAIGWGLAQKFGHEPETLMKILDEAPESQQPDIVKGMGWGTSSAILEATGDPRPEKSDKLLSYIHQYPPQWQPVLQEGVRMAFEPWITPTLDSNFVPILEKDFPPLEERYVPQLPAD